MGLEPPADPSGTGLRSPLKAGRTWPAVPAGDAAWAAGGFCLRQSQWLFAGGGRRARMS